MKRLFVTIASSALFLIVLVLPAGSGASEQIVHNWAARYGANNFDVPYDMAVDPVTGNIYVTGFIFSEETGTDDYGTVAYSSIGVELWKDQYDGPGEHSDDDPTAIAVDPSNGNVYVTGRSEQDYLTIAYGASGVKQWTASYDGPGPHSDYAYDVAVDSSNGNVYVTGSVSGIGGTGTSADCATVAYSSSGVLLWDAVYDGPGDSSDGCNAIAVNASSHDVYVAGSSTGEDTVSDYVTAAYDYENGVELWAERYDSTGVDRAFKIAVDSSTGNVYAMGKSGHDGTTVAYGSGGGAPLWEARFVGSAQGIATDPLTGNVYVTGNSNFYDYITVAYNSGGTELWMANYDGGSHYSVAHDIALDPATGNVYVTGESSNAVTNFTDFATVAYDPAGTELWVGRYNNEGGRYAFPWSIAVDSSRRKVYVAGSNSFDNTGDYDFVTVQYSMLEPPYQFLGFLPPVEELPAVNTINAGRTVSVKFRMIDGTGAYISDLEAVTDIRYQSIPCEGTTENDVPGTSEEGRSSLKYDMDDNQFIYLWKTEKEMTGCYSLFVEIYGSDQYQLDFEMK